MVNRFLAVFVVLAIALAGGFGGSLAAQGSRTSSDMLDALLLEVRGLRTAMEQMVSAGPRISLALGRLQLQEQRVNNLLRRHTEVRERLAGVEGGVAALDAEVERLQEIARDSSDAEVRTSVQFELKKLKPRQAQMSVDLQRLRGEEADVAQLLALEQDRWSEINQRLEALERALASR